MERKMQGGVGATSTRGMSAEGSLRQWLPTSKHRSRRLYGGIKKGDKKGASGLEAGVKQTAGSALGFRVDQAFFPASFIQTRTGSHRSLVVHTA